MKVYKNGVIRYYPKLRNRTDIDNPPPSPAILIMEMEEAPIRKRYYTMQEVADLLEEKVCNVRYWFNFLQLPTCKGKHLKRRVRDDQLAVAEKVKHQLRVEGPTLRKVKEMIETKPLF